MKNSKSNAKNRVLIMCECAVMVALASALSFVKILELPYGGSVTAFSAVPIIIISYRHGLGYGLLSGAVFSLVQLISGASNLSYATSLTAAIAIVMLDYILAFTVIGLAGCFKKVIKNPSAAAVAGTVMVCAARYVFHVISGCTVWAGVSIPSTDGLIYSLSYNATYMLPETIISAAAVFWLFSCLDFGSQKIGVAKKQERSLAVTALTSAAVLSIAAAVIVDAVTLFASMQNAETGALDLTLAANANFTLIIIASIAGVVLCAAFAAAAFVCGKKTAVK